MLTSTWWQHFSVVGAYTAGLLLVIWLLARANRPELSRRFVITFAILGVLACVLVDIWWLRPAKFTWRESLPLQLCDIAGMIAPLALLTQHPRLRALLHFWGFGLCSQWVFTPVANAGPGKIEFWVSFVLHASILGAAGIDVLLNRYRPTWNDCRFVGLVGIGYSALALPLNLLTQGNYGYMGNSRPNAPTIVDALGDWPLRIIWVMLIGLLAIALVQCVWQVLRRMGIRWAEPTPTYALSPTPSRL